MSSFIDPVVSKLWQQQKCHFCCVLSDFDALQLQHCVSWCNASAGMVLSKLLSTQLIIQNIFKPSYLSVYGVVCYVQLKLLFKTLHPLITSAAIQCFVTHPLLHSAAAQLAVWRLLWQHSSWSSRVLDITTCHCSALQLTEWSVHFCCWFHVIAVLKTLAVT